MDKKKETAKKKVVAMAKRTKESRRPGYRMFYKYRK